MSLSPDVFTYVAELVQRRAGIQLDAGKEYLVEGRLQPLAKVAGHQRVDSYVRALRVSETPSFVQAVVEALTTNETSFFRDGSPFRLLSDHIVPALKGPDGSLPRLRVWSAACSTGQEPYSIAMTLADCLGPETAVEIVASDLNAAVLERAGAGEYSRIEANRGLPSAMLVRHFESDGSHWRVREPLRRQITFLRHNLLDPPAFGGQFDVVFLRNVLIYFDLPVKRQVLGHVLGAMRPGGFLVLGAAETTIGLDDVWQRVPVDRGALYRAAPRTPTWALPTSPTAASSPVAVPAARGPLTGVVPRTAPPGVVPHARPAYPPTGAPTAPAVRTATAPVRGETR
ncbi:CheR family methyltransferase [Cellulomonas sp. URHB0016]